MARWKAIGDDSGGEWWGEAEGVLAGLFRAGSLQRPLCVGGTGPELLR